MRHRKLLLGMATGSAMLIALNGGAAVADPATRPAGPAVPAQCAAPGTTLPRCVTMTAKLDTAPAVGQDARLHVELTARVDIDGLRVELAVPDLLRWETAPSGFAVRRQASVRPSDYGAVQIAARSIRVRAGETVRFDGVVTAVRAGHSMVHMTATSGRGPAYGSDEAQVPLTVGETAATSRLGMPKDGTGAPVPASARPTKLNPHVPYVAASTRGLPEPYSDDLRDGVGIQALSCVTGSVDYQDPDGAWHLAKNVQYQVWDDDVAGDDLLTVGLTDATGSYRACFDNNDGIGGGGGQDVFVRVITESGQFSVEDHDDDPYGFNTSTVSNLGDGRTHNFGRWRPANPMLMSAFYLYDLMDDASAWTPGECWDARDDSCQSIDTDWEAGSTDGTYFDTGDNESRLTGADANNWYAVLHELGHGVMDDAYDDNYPEISEGCSRQHFLNERSDAVCAFTEGFANFYAAKIVNRPELPGRGNIDTATWGTPGWHNGEEVEGRVAGALWDLLDGGSEQWDTYSEPLNHVWDIILDYRAEDFEDFWRFRGERFDVGDRPMGALYQNTIDRGFRQPLVNGAELLRPAPSAATPHNFGFTTQYRFWSVVALRPPATADYDLVVFDDRAQQQRLEESLHGAGGVDFVAIDSNVGRRDLGDYYPRVPYVNGFGDYEIELADSGSLLPAGAAEKRAMSPADLVAVWDVCLVAGQPVTLTVTPDDAGQDPELFLVDSESAAPSTHLRGRSDAVAVATATGPGQPETITYTPRADGCHGVVLVNKAGGGTCTLTRS